MSLAVSVKPTLFQWAEISSTTTATTLNFKKNLQSPFLINLQVKQHTTHVFNSIGLSGFLSRFECTSLVCQVKVVHIIIEKWKKKSEAHTTTNRKIFIIIAVGRLGFAFWVDYFLFKVNQAGKPLHGKWSEENKNEIWKPSPSLGSGLFAAALRSDFSKFLYHLPGIFFWNISSLVVCSEDGVNNLVIEIVVGLGKF